MPKWLKTTLKVLGGFVALIIIIFIGLTVYVSYNKQKVLTLITNTLNKSLDGSLSIGDIDPTFFSGFPGVSVSLKNVLLKDNQWAKHHHTLLQAGDVGVSVNALSLLMGDVDINKIVINNASIDLFTDSTGYSNTAVFGKKKPDPNKPKDTESSEPPIIQRINFNNVKFAVDNRKAYKLFKFEVRSLKGKVDYPSEGWKAHLDMDTRVVSLAFNTRRGSFIKDKVLKGPFDIDYTSDSQVINVAPNKLYIGEDLFTIGAVFNMAKDPVNFTIKIHADELLWRHAGALLAPNITEKLNMFNLAKPLLVNATIAGDFGGGGDPAIDVDCKVRNNTLTSPGGTVEDCNFDGVFTNNYVKGKGLGDENSAIKLFRFTGKYDYIPFTADTSIIANLNKPLVIGTFRSDFPLIRLNPVLGEEAFKFSKGNAKLKLRYTADVVDYKLNKPILTGIVSISNADIKYLPRNLDLKNTSLSIHFAGDNLMLNNIRLQSGRSVVLMEGKISNFLNLYYNAPEKILLTWNIRSPQMYLGEFLGILNARTVVKRPVKRNPRRSNLADQVNAIFEKGSAQMHLSVDKVYYKKFLATDAKADILLANNSLLIRNVSVKHAGGSLNLNGKIIQNGPYNSFAINSKVNNVDISHFFYAFSNFGLTSLTSSNLRGYLSSTANVSGRISNTGDLVPRSVNGTITFNLKEGALLSFAPIKSVGKFAFPFRDLDNIKFSNLGGKFDLRGNLITINPMQINSSVLNMDIAGIYSLTTGTNIALDVPLRNPKDDYKITDKAERDKKRMKGIVIHLLATDGDDGKIKIKLNRNRKKDKDKDKDDKEKEQQEDVAKKES
ncbi:hypothetical protein GCM10023149_18940 [Mucilaginibacter gynuensis]|uniref:AsmA domain-containing protein n=1 Tax=Mucilaginibacter gynuensis TaxID=1302236 RepID=A0ABP8G960_9SPHI